MAGEATPATASLAATFTMRPVFGFHDLQRQGALQYRGQCRWQSELVKLHVILAGDTAAVRIAGIKRRQRTAGEERFGGIRGKAGQRRHFSMI